MTSRDRIEQGKVPQAVQSQLTQREPGNWCGLGRDARVRFYDAAIAEHRRSHAMSNGFANNLLSQGVAQGRGGCLVHAIQNAYRDSDQYKDEANRRHEAVRNEMVECGRCGDQYGRGSDSVLVMGAKATCHNCAWEISPEAAEMFGLPKPTR